MVTAVFRALGRRVVESLVTLFAVLGFCCVPLGSKTGLQHTLTLAGTRPVREATTGVLSALTHVRTLIVTTLLEEAEGAEPLPIPSGRSTGGSPVRPIPPHLKRP